MGERRRAARVLLIDEHDHILLLRGTDPSKPEAGFWWFTPGGGMNEGEVVEEAARRELFEETGLADANFGPVLFTRSIDFDFQGVEYHQDEWYVAAQVERFAPDFSGFDAYEVDAISTARWWSRDELATTTETVFPENLAELLDRHVPEQGQRR